MGKTIFTIIVLFSICGFSQNRSDRAERELKTLEKLHKEVENNKLSEFEAKKNVLNFYYDMKSEVRENYKYLSEKGKTELDKSQKSLWEAKVVYVIKIYETYGYRKFLRDQYNVLLKYNEAINELMYFAMDNELEIEKNSKEYDEIYFNYYWENWMEKP